LTFELGDRQAFFFHFEVEDLLSLALGSPQPGEGGKEEGAIRGGATRKLKFREE
jgi:hypothetical protein